MKTPLFLMVWFLSNFAFAAQNLGPPPVPQTGQIIAISESQYDPSTFIIEAGSGSRYGHIAIIVNEPDLDAPSHPMTSFVYEANPPYTRKVPLNKFLRRTGQNAQGLTEYTLLEPLVALTPVETQRLIDSVHKMVADQIPYNYSMVTNSNSLNCSEFVARAFMEAKKLKLGQIETMGDMNLGSFNGNLIKLWGNTHPANSPVITPVSIVNSPELKVVFATLPVETVLSDQEIFQAWKSQKSLSDVADQFGLSLDRLEEFGTKASVKPYRAYPSKWRQAPTGGCAVTARAGAFGQ